MKNSKTAAELVNMGLYELNNVSHCITCTFLISLSAFELLLSSFLWAVWLHTQINSKSPSKPKVTDTF